MAPPLSYIQTGCRLALAGVFAHQALSTLFPALPFAVSPIPRLSLVEMVPGVSIVLGTLLLIISIWLLFGIYSRVVTLWGAAILATACISAAPGALPGLDCLVPLAALAALALPVVLLGGGAFAMRRSGWKIEA